MKAWFAKIKVRRQELMKSSPDLFVIAGPNGAGKTTFALEFLPRFTKCHEFINADLIARGPITAKSLRSTRPCSRRSREDLNDQTKIDAPDSIRHSESRDGAAHRRREHD
jgi:predicted ATP-binding protein involved in virulence